MNNVHALRVTTAAVTLLKLLFANRNKNSKKYFAQGNR